MDISQLPRQDERNNLVLLALALSEGAPLSPVQLQKAVFLLQKRKRLQGEELCNEFFQFIPDNYGPFSGEVFDAARCCSRMGLVEISRAEGKNYDQYALSVEGVRKGKRLIAQLGKKNRAYARKLIKWVRSQSFSSLVRAIYSAYPDYKVNSIFSG